MQEFFNWQGVIGTVAGVIGTIVSIFVYFKSQKIEKFLEKEKERLTERVSFILKDGNREKTLPFLRRQEVIRGEIIFIKFSIMLGNFGTSFLTKHFR